MMYVVLFGVLIAILVYWIILLQRTFVALDENINNAMSQIGVQISSRWDALTLLLDLTNGYAIHQENEALKELIKERRLITRGSSHGDILKQEYILTEVIEMIRVVAESYPELKEDTSYIKMLDGVNQYEKMVRTSRLIYNDSVMRLNRAISIFPTSLFAGMIGFSKREYLEAAVEETHMPI